MMSSKFEVGSSKGQIMSLNVERLLVYQKALDFVDHVYTATREWSFTET